MERDNRTRFGARAPGVEQQRLLERRRFNAQRPPAQNGDQMYATGSVKDRGKPSDVQAASNGQAQSDIPALKPYWGKPAVRNFREGHGNVGIIRSPLRAIALPDPSLADSLLHEHRVQFFQLKMVLLERSSLGRSPLPPLSNCDSSPAV